MTSAQRVDPALVSLVRDLKIDEDYLRYAIDQLTSIGSSPLGFRNTGTQEDAAVAEFVSGEMSAMGLTGVAIEDVEVDAWRFRSATVTDHGSGTRAATLFDGSSFGGVPGTPPGGVTARLVDVGEALRLRLDRLDLGGAIALVDWRDQSIEPAAIILELARRGAVGMLLNCPVKGPWYQSSGALGAFNSRWPTGAPPMILIRKEDADTLREGLAYGPAEVTMTLNVEFEAHAAGHNAVGYLSGELPGPIVVGAHHDAWFRAAFDNASGVAALLAIARALSEAGHRPRHTICFSTRTAEEYGIAGSAYDWCIGAWRQVEVTHPNWATESPFHLCLEATGHRALRTVVEAPVELSAWAKRVCRAAEREGWTPTGWRVALPVADTEQWPFLLSGIPGVASYAWEESFGKTDYHTQFDTSELLDFGYLAAQSRLYALLLLEADRDPDAVFNHRARASELTKIAATTGHSDLARAAENHADAKGRRSFTTVGRGLFALDAHARARYPHEQTLADITSIDAAVAALDSEDLITAYRSLLHVGSHFLFPYLSEEAFIDHNHRSHPESLTRTWARASHLTSSPHLWREMAALCGDSDARPYGPWVRASLIRAGEEARQQLVRRLDSMTRSIRPTGEHTLERTPTP